MLAASQQPLPTSTFCQPSTSNNKKAALVLPAPPPPVAYIPTPDATGKVDNYADFYPELHSQPSSLLAKASETLEEGQADSLAGGYAYVMDERDSDWLERNNKLANGEGPSNSASTPRGSRSAKARGKEPELPPTVLISEDEFELVMGLFEKHTDEKFPYLHLVRADASHTYSAVTDCFFFLTLLRARPIFRHFPTTKPSSPYPSLPTSSLPSLSHKLCLPLLHCTNMPASYTPTGANGKSIEAAVASFPN